jgi:acyl carrier protein
MSSSEYVVAVDAMSADSVEAYLVSVWRRVLRSEDIGPHDNFFDRGGDSLIALEMLAAIDDAIDTDVSVPTLYDRPTIAELCDYIVATGAR